MAKTVTAVSTYGNMTLTNGYLRVDHVSLLKKYKEVGGVKTKDEKWVVDFGLYQRKEDTQLIDALLIPIQRGSMFVPYDKNKNPITEAYKSINTLTMPGWTFTTITDNADADD
jgi:hypothetical protein